MNKRWGEDRKRLLVCWLVLVNHLSADLDTATKVGKRHGQLVILEVAAKLMFGAGHSFFISENGVWLTDTVPVEYLKQR